MHSSDSSPTATLYTSANSHHSHQVISGYIALARRGDLQLRINWSPTSNLLPSKAWVLAEVNGARIAYDTDDGDVLSTDIVDAFADNVDVVFRRSMAKTPRVNYRTAHKHQALGLNYHATARSPYFYQSAFRSNRGLRSLGAMLLVERDNAWRLKPNTNPDDGTIIFQTRLWDPPLVTRDSSERDRQRAGDRAAINRDRIALIRALRDAFGERFVGGLAPTAHAIDVASDLVLSRRQASPAAFAKALGRARICVTSRGLWNSNGWKLAEYMGQGRAVVAESLLHEAPGLQEGTHLVSFVDSGAAVDSISKLDKDETSIGAMRRDARQYFLDYVEPSALVARSLRVVHG